MMLGLSIASLAMPIDVAAPGPAATALPSDGARDLANT
jgi:hypothetical protein